MGFIYNIFYSIFFVIFFPLFIFLTKKRGYSLDLKDRFTLYKSKTENPLWFHCASVGELNTARPIIQQFKEDKILITVSSPRGKSYAQKLFPDAVIKTVPFDFPLLIKKFLKLHSPKALIITEGEFWYNLITISSKSIPVISINARVSPSSFKIYRILKPLYRKIFSSFSLIITRSKTDTAFISSFTDGRKIINCGDLKFASSKVKKTVKVEKNGRVLIAGSTHNPEEKVILKIYKDLKEEFPDLKLFIAPRHLERIDEVKQIIKSEGLDWDLRTQTDKPKKDIYLIDTIGELSALYRYADVVFIGGTIAPVGGHNILEAVLENKPVIIGSNYEKIKEAVDELQEEGAVKVVFGEENLKKQIKEFLKGNYKIPDYSQKAERIIKCYLKNIKTVIGENR